MGSSKVLAFAAQREDYLFSFHNTLWSGIYQHDPYEHFFVHDPKRRYISEASVKDRVAHQAVVQIIEPLFERGFIFDSYASRRGKGIHAAVARLENFLRQASGNYHRPVYVLKCDIKKFFDSVDHEILLNLLARRINDQKLMSLLRIFIASYAKNDIGTQGIPLGNVTSQLFANIYLDGFDHFIKEELRLKWYLRFCDDFLIVHPDLSLLESLIPLINNYLVGKRRVTLHSKKVFIRKFSHGVDFVGQVVRPHVITLRTKTKRRLLRRVRILLQEYKRGTISDELFRASLQSCFGVLSYGDNYKTKKCLRKYVEQNLL